jgi:uncharacterized protein YcbK (DUF882 family)
MHALALIVLFATTPGGMQPAAAVDSVTQKTLKKSQPRVMSPQKHAPKPKARARKAEYPPVEMFAANLRERFLLRPFDEHGRPRKTVDRELTRFLRCWHTGKQHKVDSRLAKVVYAMGRHFPGKRIELYSGYRPRKYCTREHSRHLTASAIDFRIPGVRNEALVAWLRERFHPVGVGYYPGGVHVHLDVDRARDTFWIDNGDEPRRDSRPLVAVGDTAPSAIEATADEPVEMTAIPGPSDPGADPQIEIFDDDLPPPPAVDPAIPE